MVPIIGRAHVLYPDNHVVGISKLARVVEIFAKRLQIQEKMTVDIAATIDKVLKLQGVAVAIEASHQCMTTRGVRSQRGHGDQPDVGRFPRRSVDTSGFDNDWKY